MDSVDLKKKKENVKDAKSLFRFDILKSILF
jgi:hypothetical protein